MTTSDAPQAIATGPRYFEVHRLEGQRLAVLDEVAGEEDGEGDLGELAGLEADRPDLDPDLGAADLLAETGHERQQQQHDADEQERVAVAGEVAGPAHDDEGGDVGADADRGPRRLEPGEAVGVGLASSSRAMNT